MMSGLLKGVSFWQKTDDNSMSFQIHSMSVIASVVSIPICSSFGME